MSRLGLTKPGLGGGGAGKCNSKRCKLAQMSDLVIRPAGPHDLDLWARMRCELWPTCSLERHRLEIDQLIGSEGLVALALRGGQAVGFAELSIRHDHVEGTARAPVPYLEGWYVAAAHRGQGIGTRLLGFLEQWARERGYREIASDAEIDNAASIRLHLGRGFAEVGRSVHFVKRLSGGKSRVRSRSP